MVFDAKVLRVLIASPSDLEEERIAIREAVFDWNSNHAFQEKIILLPLMWETDIRPRTGRRAQTYINDELVKPSDIILGSFWTKVGHPTGTEESGSIEEIKLGVADGKEVMLYFSNREVRPDRVDFDQYQKLQTFREWCRENSLYSEYEEPQQLRHLVERHLSSVVRDIKGSWQYKTPPKGLTTSGSTPAVTAVGAEEVSPTRQPSEGAPDSVRAPNLTDAIPADLNQKAGSSPINLALLHSAAETEFIRQRVGNSPLDTGLMRRDLSKKACILPVIQSEPRMMEREILVPFAVFNDGRYRARGLMVTVDNGDETIFSSPAMIPMSLKPGESSPVFALQLPRTTGANPNEQEFWTFVLTATFEDALGDDETKFVFHMSGIDPNLKIYEDTSRANFSPLCSFLRPNS